MKNSNSDELGNWDSKDEYIKELKFWLQWCLDNCDDSPEWDFGTDATDKIRSLLTRNNYTD